jgi:hypothetical protein
MSNVVRAFRHPSADELQRLMEAARRERSMFLAGLLRLRPGEPRPRLGPQAQPEPRAVSGMAA